MSFPKGMDWELGGRDGVTNDVGGVGPGIDDMSGVYHDEVGGTCGVMCDVESDLLIPIPISPLPVPPLVPPLTLIPALAKLIKA